MPHIPAQNSGGVKANVEDEDLDGSPSSLCRNALLRLFGTFDVSPEGFCLINQSEAAGHPILPSPSGQVLFPWTKIARLLMKCALMMVGYPFPVPLPTETALKKASQGIKDLKSEDALLLLAALKEGSVELVSVDRKRM